ncbi:MAG: FGGY family carbohydrate kinase [Anaerolineae bacterium]
MTQLIGLDLGTTTVTGVLWDAEEGQVLGLAQRRNDAAGRSGQSTRAEQDPHRLRTLSLEVLKELVTGGGRQGGAGSSAPGDHRLDGLALTGQMHGLLCVDAENQPLTPLISWQDQRTAEPLPGGPTTLDRIHARLEDLDWRPNGCRLQHGYGAATLFWIAQNGQLPAGTHRVCTLADWLAGKLTGQLPVTDPTLAASWGVYHLLDGGWNAAFLERLDLETGLFPPVRPSAEPLGGLAPQLARHVGLPAGLPVFNGVGDSQAAFAGATLPLTDGTEGELAVEEILLFNLGTGGQVCWAVGEFEVPTEAVETRPLPQGCFLRVGASLCGGAAYAWLNRTVRAWLAEFGVEVGEDAVYERLNALAADSRGAEGLCVRTTFLGVRGDPAVKTGAIEGITLEAMRLGPLARATLTGVVDELRDLYRDHAGRSAGATRIVATGGGVWQNPLLPGLIEARFGLPVQVSRQREAAAVGAAMLASGISTPMSGQSSPT